ncbi:MAG TPA: hypothetical protein VEL76_04420 [Gemmataceae bacterium]|nr:hypothetical protein [Gemmataceae bacterium]
MGGTRWSDDHYKERERVRAKSGKATFEHDDDVRAGRTAAKVHQKLNPHGVKVRESRDSEAHPTAHGVSVLFDVTGSMQAVPQILQKNLPRLMGLLLRKGYLEHPAIMVGAIGDATCDAAPLQLGQFESGIEIENDLTNIYLEGGGGESITESYELAMYFMARHTVMDCFEKRGKRGYLFIVGDEIPYAKLKREEVERVLGDTLQADIPIEQLVAELTRTFDVYFILPHMTSNYNNPMILKRWSELLPQRVLRLEEPAGICELIASTVGIAEGVVDIADLERDLKEAGSTPTIVQAVGNAVAPVARRAAGKAVDVAVPASGKGSGIAKL